MMFLWNPLGRFLPLAAALANSRGSALVILVSLGRNLKCLEFVGSVTQEEGMACGPYSFALSRVTVAVAGILANLSAAMHAWPMWINHSPKAVGRTCYSPQIHHSLAAGPPLMEIHKLCLHMRNVGPCLFTPECVSPSSNTHRNLIRALETQIFLFNPLNPASTPWDPLCWVNFWRICCRLNFDFCLLTGTHQKRESCSGSAEVGTPFSLGSFREWRDFCLFLLSYWHSREAWASNLGEPQK